MKKLLLLFCFALTAFGQSRYVKEVANPAALVQLNPNDINHLAMCTNGAGLFVYDAGSSTSTNTSTVYKPTGYSGRWLAVSPTAVATLTEIGYLSGVTSAIQTQLGAKQVGPLTGDVTTSGAAATLAVSGVTAGVYGNTAYIPQITVDAKGRVTSVTTNAVSGGGGSGLVDGDYGDVTVSGSASVITINANAVTSGKITANAITLAKMATQADGTVLGNSSGITAVPSAIGTLPTAVMNNITRVGTLAAGSIPSSLLTGLAYTDLPTRTLTAGAGLSGGGTLAADRTFTWDASTFVNNVTLWDGNNSSRTLTINLSGTDPVFTFSSGVVNLSAGDLQVGGVSLKDATGLTSGTLPSARLPALSGDVTSSAGSAVTTIANDAVTTAKILNSNVTLAKVANIADGTVLGNSTGSSTAPAAIGTLPTAVQDNITRLGTVTTGSLDAARIASGTLAAARLPSSAKARGVGYKFYAGGSALAVGMIDYVPVDVGFTISMAKVTADRSGSITIAVRSQTYSSYDAATWTSIVASAPPTLSLAIKSKDTTLTGWTTAIPDDSYVQFEITAVSGGITNAVVYLPGQ